MTSTPPPLLVTGFEPFGGSAMNPSERIVAALPDRIDDRPIERLVLPVDAEAAPARLRGAIDAADPAAVICLGESGRAAALTLERLAVNLLDFRIPDNAGLVRRDLPVVAGGPAAYFATLPIRAVEAALERTGHTVMLSHDAGAYLCNQIAYVALHHLAKTGRTDRPAGFVHLPRLPEQGPLVPGGPVLPLERTFDAVMRTLTIVAAASPVPSRSEA